MAEETKHCGNCKYAYLGPGYEPCKSCGNDCSKWESDVCGIIPIPVDMRYVVTKEEKYTYYISYVIASSQMNLSSTFLGSTIERSSKISSLKDIQELRIILAHRHDVDIHRISVIDWKELEG